MYNSSTSLSHDNIWFNTTINSAPEITSPEATSEPEPEPEAEPDCFLKSNDLLLDSLWVIVPATIGLGFSALGYFHLLKYLTMIYTQSGVTSIIESFNFKAF